ncbi:hypothetical protein [Mesorhizobium sp. WSM4884]|uniref:hypothetical protein n=1 Tax=Mesorhizobium sp. WSM4884 TaxID=3038542 RepID=UPI002416478F|nr:hypothetical protein [Mesorhizobium sp. WSM4884]MDG4884478.1 hypothetical protein [Mesorhizobium sp. WSM4884]
MIKGWQVLEQEEARLQKTEQLPAHSARDYLCHRTNTLTLSTYNVRAILAKRY